MPHELPTVAEIGGYLLPEAGPPRRLGPKRATWARNLDPIPKAHSKVGRSTNWRALWREAGGNVERKAVLMEYHEADNLWRIYWSGTRKLADERWFSSIEAAGVAARAVVFPPASSSDEQSTES